MTAQAAKEQAADRTASGVVHGPFIVVVGPSGAGKDTLIDFARARLAGDPAVLFVRRVVTRPAEADAEDHESLGEALFAEAEDEGAFAFTWRAHGLSYGLPRALDHHLARGGVAVANGSRATLARLAARYRDLRIVHIAVSRDVLAERLERRGRETPAEIAARLERAGRCELSLAPHLTIDNDGAVEAAGGELVHFIREAQARGRFSA